MEKAPYNCVLQKNYVNNIFFQSESTIEDGSKHTPRPPHNSCLEKINLDVIYDINLDINLDVIYGN